MIDVTLLGHRINTLFMKVDARLETGPLQLTSNIKFSIASADDNESSAKATLLSRTEYRENPDMFFLELELQAIFEVHGITNIDEREEANLKCYEELFYRLEEILIYLIEKNTGIVGFQLQKPDLLPEGTNSEVNKPAGESSSGRIIEFKTDL